MTARLAALILLLLATACSSSPWEQYPSSLYAVLREDTPAAVRSHHDLLGQLIDDSEGSGRKPPPGMFAEFAFYAWIVGAQDDAHEAIRRERENYPESTKFLEVLERFLPSLATIEDAEGSS